MVAAVIPFVLLAPCLRRSAFRVEDQGGTREEVEIGEKSAVPYADNVGFTADEAMRDDEQAAHVREQAIVVEGTGPKSRNCRFMQRADNLVIDEPGPGSSKPDYGRLILDQ